MSRSGNSWLEFVQFFHQNNPELSYKQALQEASEPYKKLKHQYQKKRGGAYSFNNIDLKDPQMRFEAGVSALNSNLKGIDRPVIFGGNGVAFNNIDLKDPQMRFEAGVSALNSNLKGIGRSIIFGGNGVWDDNDIPLKDPQMRFEAGVSALNSNLKNIGDPVLFGGQKQKKQQQKHKRDKY